MISRENLIRLLNQKKAEYSNSNYKQIRRGICKAINIAHDMPTVDAVPVVRCRDCKHHYDSEFGYVVCVWFDEIVSVDGYCNYGCKLDAEVEG